MPFWLSTDNVQMCAHRTYAVLHIRILLYKLLFSRGFYFREFREPDPRENFPLQFMSIYSNDNIRKIAKLTTCELPQKSKNAKITVRENNGLYSICFVQCLSYNA